MNPLAPVIDITEPRRMAPSDYEREREAIRATYGDSSGEAAALRDQALAKLFYRSGWTQEELAAKEGKSRSYLAQRLIFGRFLSFVATGNIPRNLTERRFRDYWSRTDKSETNERIRFREVLKLMESETTLRRPQRPGVGKEIAERFADGKWHDVETIAKHVNGTVESLDTVFQNMRSKRANGIGLCEDRRHGKTIQYRMRKAGRTIDLEVLMEELQPLIDGLKAEGRKNMATMSPDTVAALTVQLERLIEKLVKQSAANG